MAAPCGEIVTVQLGPFSNCLGAHWWNLQDAEISRQSHKRQQESEICSDVTYRQGVTLRGRQTYTPRLIAVDLKGGLSSLREEGFLYEDRDTTCATPAWTGNLSTHREEPQETSPLQAELRREKDLHRDMYQLLNCIMGIVHLSNHSSLFCPLTLSSCLGRRPGPPVALPHLLYDAESQYHSSAVLALTLDTLSAPYRTAPSRLPMVQLADALSFSGRKVSVGGACYDGGLLTPIPAGKLLPRRRLPAVYGGPALDLSVWLWGATQRGGERKLLPVSGSEGSHPLPPGTRPPSVLHTCSSASDTLQCYLQTVAPGAVSLASTLPAPCTLPPTFPQFFSPYVTRSGFTAETPLSEPSAVDSIPALAALQTGRALGPTLQALHKEVRGVDVRRWPSFLTAGVEEGQLEETLEELQRLAHCYTPEGDSD
uniref:Misato Segment II tubulin-like domain-containing protein n=1 Tax=Xenopus tropicalis TaxID=8364 RepID=A0A1B8XY43_XENTR